MLAAITAAPDDDALRLVYADFLSERGDTRGELIHLQCGGGHPIAPADRDARVAALLELHREAWAATDVGLPGKQVQYRRGFPDRILVRESDLARVARVARRASSERRVVTPPIDVVRVCGCTNLTANLIADCLVLGARRLDLNDSFLSSRPALLFPILDPENPVYRELRGLAVAGCKLGAERIAHMVSLLGLQGVRDLVVRRNGRVGIGEALAQTRWPNIRTLDATVNNLRDAGVKALAASKLLRPTTLRLRRNGVGAEGFATLVTSRLIARARHLDVADNPLRSIAEPLLASPFATELEELDVTGCFVPNSEIERILEAMPSLVILTDTKTCEALESKFPARVRTGNGPVPW